VTARVDGQRPITENGAVTDAPSSRFQTAGYTVLHTWRTALAHEIDELAAALHAPVPYPRGRHVIALAAPVQEARQAFWTRAVPAADLASDKRRRTRQPRGATRRGTTDS
jgi:hypothetical protein